MPERRQEFMHHRVIVDRDNGIVLCECEGTGTEHDIFHAAREARRQAYEAGLPLLYDARRVVPSFPASDVYSIVRDERRMEKPAHEVDHIALLATEHQDFWTFYETTARNAGINVRVFTSREPALDWLRQAPAR